MKIVTNLMVLGLLTATSAQAHDDQQIASDGSKQLCYVASNDIGARQWVKKASFFLAPLETASQQGVDACWGIDNESKANEARMLVAMDPTQTTLIIK